MTAPARPLSLRTTLLPFALATTALATLGAPHLAAQAWTPLAEVQTLGSGTRGAAGIPELAVLGWEALDQPGAGLRLRHGRPRALAQIILSLAQGPTPLPAYGAQLWPAAPVTRWTTLLDAHGDSPVFASGPAPMPPALAGVDVFAQGLVLDAAAQGGAAFTAGRRVRGGAGSTGASLFELPAYFVDPEHFASQHGNMPVADLDGNGLPDVVVAAGSAANSTIRVLRQLQDGTLAPPLVFPVTAGSANDLQVADLDGDGTLDVLAALGSGLQLVLFPGLGNGALGTAQSIATPAHVTHIAVGDVTGDGRPDVVAAGWVAHGVAVLPGLPGGGLGAPVILSVGDAQYAVEVRLADADGDTLTDILLVRNTPVNTFAKLAVVRSLGGGAFAPETSFPVDDQGASLFAVGNLDGDAFPDVVVAGNTHLRVLLNDGHGAYPSSVLNVPMIPGLGDMALADFDEDGQDEVLVASFQQTLSSLEHVGSGVLGPAQDFGGFGARFTLADLNVDAHVDLVANASNPFSQISVFEGKGDGTVTLPAMAPGFITVTSVAADLDADGDPDAVGILLDETLSVVLGDGRGHFGPASVVPAGGRAQRLAVGDLDGDGALDVVVIIITPASEAGFAVLRGLGDGTFAAPEVHLGTSSRDVQIADVTQDGRPDVIFTQTALQPGLLVFPTLADGSLDAPVLTPPGTAKLNRLALGDIDGDGQADAISNGSSLTVFLGTGSAAFQQGTVIPGSGTADTITPLALGDFDADGDLDLVQVGSLAGLQLWFNDGAGHFAKGASGLATFVLDVNALDVNGDGVADVIGSGVWLSLGDGTFAPFQPGQVGGTPGDFDSDGDVDFLQQGYLFPNALQ